MCQKSWGRNLILCRIHLSLSNCSRWTLYWFYKRLEKLDKCYPQLPDTCRCGILHVNKPFSIYHKYCIRLLSRKCSHSICQKLSGFSTNQFWSTNSQADGMLHYLTRMICPCWGTWSPWIHVKSHMIKQICKHSICYMNILHTIMEQPPASITLWNNQSHSAWTASKQYVYIINTLNYVGSYQSSSV